jgi:DNA-binding MarR family transcriptional regulator
MGPKTDYSDRATDDPTDCPYYVISRATLVATSALKKALAEAGMDQVKPAYLGALLVLWKEDGLKTVELGRRAGLETSTMTGLLDRMERDNLVSRAADQMDRRAHNILLTNEGREIQNAVLVIVDQVLSRIFRGISQDELRIASSVLRRVLANAQEGNES